MKLKFTNFINKNFQINDLKLFRNLSPNSENNYSQLDKVQLNKSNPKFIFLFI